MPVYRQDSAVVPKRRRAPLAAAVHDTVNRRKFLVMAAACSVMPVAAAEAKRPPIVDTHTHCFAGKADARFPYHPRGTYQPEQPTTPEFLLKLMDGAGVDFAVVVHPEPYQDDHRYLEHCLAVGKGRLKGTVLVFADRPGSIEQLPELAKRLPVVTARIHAYQPVRLPPFGKSELRRLWQLAGDHGLAMQLHFIPEHAAGFEPLIREFKQTRVIVDHLGRPFDAKPEHNDRILRWADFPNVVMKLSSLPAPASKEAAELPRVLRRLADAFGPDRLIYGGGFDEKATAESYRRERERLAGLLSFLTAEAQAKLLGGNAAKLFRFGAG
ncbi:MAG: amidohydrolase [Verrucomicrobia bacterium]|nr:amidohydrolase [Verrucomicrobiota bacterium]